MRYFLLCLTLALFMPTVVGAQSDNKLSVFVSKTDKQWGQYLRVTLQYRGNKKLENINLESWQDLAVIEFENEYNDEDDDGYPIQVLKLRLYSRKIGRYSLPSLNLGKVESLPVDINIIPAEVKKASIKLDWKISSLSPWQREAVVVRVQMQTSDYTARLKLDAPVDKNFISRTLNIKKNVLADGRYQFAAGWIFYPIETGAVELDLPAVRYQIAGSDRRRFYFPRQILRVKSLPSYLPPTLPIGKLTVSSYVDEANQWRLKIKSDALMPHGLPELDAQLAAISRHAVVIDYSQQLNVDDYADVSVYSTDLPEWLLPLGNNLTLKIPYFDSQTGRLNNLSHTLPRSLMMPDWFWLVLLMFGLVMLFFMVRYFYPQIEKRINQRKLREALRYANNANEMRKLILKNINRVTLFEWVTDKPLRKQVVQELNYHCFSGAKNEDIQQLKNRLLQCV